MEHEYYIENRQVSERLFYVFIDFIRSSFSLSFIHRQYVFELNDSYQMKDDKPICYHTFQMNHDMSYFDVIFELFNRIYD